jgi:anti-sigma regulatory factor (Ser/Thr protein kinase)
VIDARVAPAGLVHEAALYGDQDELLDVVVPFVAAGARAGEAVVVALDGRDADRVRAATAGDPRIAYLSPADAYARPAVTLRTFRSLVDRRLAGGIARVRMVGALPARVVGSAWDAWCRYEAAVERVFARAPVSLLCAYDTRAASDEVLADVEQLHHRLALPGGVLVAPGRTAGPEELVARHPPPPPDPLVAGPPDLELVDPSVREARRRAHALAGAAGHGDQGADEVGLAVSETVSNARVHGRPPVVVRGWAGPDRVVITVADQGPGPADALVGLAPVAPDARDGRGLWIVQQLCPDVALVRAEGTFTVRLRFPRTG